MIYINLLIVFIIIVEIHEFGHYIFARLFNAKVTRSIGEIDKGTTVSDYRAEEISHQHSISLSSANYEFLDKKINVIDAPGMVDFQGEMICSLWGSDIAAFVINSVNGLEIGAELALDYCSGENNKPKMIIPKEILDWQVY